MDWGFIECNREEPLDDIKHSIYSHLKHPLTSHRTSQCNAVNQFILILSAINSITAYQHFSIYNLCGEK